jgi:hypothetical protein
MPKFARETIVPIERSKAEIEETLRRYGASEFQSGWKQQEAMIAFRLDNLFIRFVLPFPAPDDRRFTHKKIRGREQKVSELQMSRAYEQELRSRWRALLLVIKAKLEAVECGISTLSHEFLAFVVLPNDTTLGDWFIGEMLPQIAAGKMPQLGYRPSSGTQSGEVSDADFEIKGKG